MTPLQQLKGKFCPTGSHSIIELDWDGDIAPMFAGHEMVEYAELSGDSMEGITKQLPMVPELFSATKVAISISYAPDFELKMSDIVIFSETLHTIPTSTEVIWGVSQLPAQPQNLNLIILFTT